MGVGMAQGISVDHTYRQMEQVKQDGDIHP